MPSELSTVKNKTKKKIRF